MEYWILWCAVSRTLNLMNLWLLQLNEPYKARILVLASWTESAQNFWKIGKIYYNIWMLRKVRRTKRFVLLLYLMHAYFMPHQRVLLSYFIPNMFKKKVLFSFISYWFLGVCFNLKKWWSIQSSLEIWLITVVAEGTHCKTVTPPIRP